MNRRQLIRMSDAEVAAFLAEQRVLTCATMGPGGRPHLAPLWYVPADGRLLAWTYASAQKARNLGRLPQATVQVEAGSSYDELRGVTMECDVELVTDPARVRDIGVAIALRYAGDPVEEAPPELVDYVARQAAKRVGLRFTPTRTASWDHRKLGGTY
jgi:PPOX class probable F420-dependent enzyme